jgi:transcriptional regulator with XRE-family HTH domain
VDIGIFRTLGARVKFARGDLTQAEFGRPLGVTRQTVSQWELDETSPTAENVFAIERAHGWSARWVVLGEGPERILERERVPGRLELYRLAQALPDDKVETAARLLAALT